MNELTRFNTGQFNYDVLLRDSSGELLTGKDRFQRIDMFVEWLNANNGQWHRPALAAYVHFLQGPRTRTRLNKKGAYETVTLKPLKASSINAHISTIRGRYNDLLASNAVRELLYRSAEDVGIESAADRKAFVDEALIRIRNGIAPNTETKAVDTQEAEKHQDRADSDFVRLTAEQSVALIASPGVYTLSGLRDTALLALMLSTGIREGEAVALNVSDLRQHYNEQLSLRVRRGKGSKARLIPYGNMDWVLPLIDFYLEKVSATEGVPISDERPVFRGFFKGGQRLRPYEPASEDGRTPETGRLTTRQIIRIVKSYPVTIEGKRRSVNPHDLRRTYARRNWEEGMDLISIRDNLGHASTVTTERYIGKMDGARRRTKQIIAPMFDIEALRKMG